MTAQLSPTPVFKGWDNNGAPLAFGKLFTYIAGTTTKQASYTDSTQTTPNTNPVILNARGEANVWLDPTKTYKLVLSPSTDTDPPTNSIWTVDQINGSLSPSASIIPSVDNVYTLGSPTLAWANLYLGANHEPAIDPTTGIIGYWPRTTAEGLASVTPTAFGYPPGDVRRYGADPTGAADSTTAFANAISANQLTTVPAGTFKLASLPNFTTGKYLIGAGRNNTTLNYTGSGSFAVFNSGAGRCRLEGFTVNGTGRTGTGLTTGDNTGNATFCYFKDLLITNFNVGYRMGGATWVTFDTVEFGNPAGGLGVITNNVGIDFNYFGGNNYTSALAFYNCVVSNNANAGVQATSVSVQMNEVQWINCNVQNNCQSTLANPQFYMGSTAGFIIDGMYMEYLFAGTKPDAIRVDGLNYGQIRSLYSNGAATAIIDRGGGSVNGVEIIAPNLFNNSTAAINMASENDVTVRGGSVSGSVTLTGTGCHYLAAGSGVASWPNDESSWTPVLTPQTSGSITQAVQAATYSRVGNVVTFNARINWTALSSPVGSLTITGFPIAPKTGGPDTACPIGYAQGITIAAGYLGGFIPNGSTTMTVYNVQTTTAAVNAATALSASGTIIISGSYQV